jgi:hypothetical protein
MNKQFLSKTLSIVLAISFALSNSLMLMPLKAKARVLCENVIVVSNTDDNVFDTIDNPLGKAVLTWNQNSAWTAIIDGASWIWKTYLVENPSQDETYIFKKDFEIIGTPTSATLKVAADNTYKAWVNDIFVGEDLTEFNYNAAGQDQYNIDIANLQTGSNSLKFEVTNLALENGTQESNPAGLLYRLEIERSSCEPPTGDIAGYKYNDLNKNGSYDVGELGLEGWNICVDGNKDGDCEDPEDDPQTTNQDGFYSFRTLPVGTYQVCEVTDDHSGWGSQNSSCQEVEVVDGVETPANFFNYEIPPTGFNCIDYQCVASTQGAGQYP